MVGEIGEMGEMGARDERRVTTLLPGELTLRAAFVNNLKLVSTVLAHSTS